MPHLLLPSGEPMNVAARIETYSCPCCGGSIGEAAPIQSIIDAEKSWVSKAILETLSKPVGKRVRRDALIEAIYQFEDEPDNAVMVFRVKLTRLRKHLGAFGWMIQREGSKGPQGGRGAVYRLLPIGGDR
ncbi:winged helix-turn-helix domain-containing protein [Rhizobium sp. ARZ01]|uniref:helix-turn-helix domain-containing protein n=1 Tax=Rhizobium sp. ARZ01 TaxID=2769313 RepID=UPI00177C54E0|nr:helix-turn-helix domain-containing protein [Rhizobium sp. ARZ01]MBD9372793.1 winged helix-turn-helix domain-containing protein [Rhizobium sp. ARZ01]